MFNLLSFFNVFRAYSINSFFLLESFFTGTHSPFSKLSRISFSTSVNLVFVVFLANEGIELQPQTARRDRTLAFALIISDGKVDNPRGRMLEFVNYKDLTPSITFNFTPSSVQLLG